MNDPRPDELLEECGRIASRLGLAIAWTDSIQGPAAKVCSRVGSANWKNAKPLADDPEAAAAFFLRRARKRNPAVVASASGLVLVESDDGPLDELVALHGLSPLPSTVRVRSRRGEHAYFRPPDGYRGPLKIQLSPEGVTCSADGYFIAAGALHPSGVVYAYVGVVR
jgi:Bifunctional DNA primase/polymerase, N-terminal